MKKLFGISLVAVLAISPLMAFSAPVAGEPTAGDANSPTATNAPKYGLKGASEDDGKAATAGYVKGAYNAVIKGINKTHDEIGTLNTNIGTYAGTVDDLLNGKATQTGTVKTIKAATTTETIDSSSVNFTGVTTSDISATASGNVDLTMEVLDNWNSDNVASTPVQITTSFSDLNVDSIAMAAPTSNTAQLTKTGIGGTVNVAEYLAQAQAQAQAAAQPYNYTPLINTEGNSYGYNSADGIYNADGLELGEWKVTWNSYGTVKGTTLCSSDWGEDEGEYGYEYGYTISGTPASITDPDAKAGCWCKMTSFTEKDNGPIHNDTSLWVFDRTTSSASDCALNCEGSCGARVRYESDMRSAMFSNVQQ